RLRSIADLGRKRDDFDGAVFPAEIPVGSCGIGGRQASLNEADRVGPDRELAIPGVGGQGPDRLALRVDVPGGAAVDHLSKFLLTLHREAGAATAGNIIPLNAHIFRFRRLAAEVHDADVALQVRAWQVALSELLTRVTPPAGGRSNV